MSERVHPAAANVDDVSLDNDDPLAPLSPASSTTTTSSTFINKPRINPGTYVVQVPKDQIFSVPPPENAHRANLYARKASSRRRRSCYRYLSYTLISIAAIVFFIAVVAGILYLSLKPKLPEFSIINISAAGLNPATTTTRARSPGLSPNVTTEIRSINPNKKLAVKYTSNGSVKLLYSSADSTNVAQSYWPEFKQPKRNSTTVKVLIKGSGVRLSDAMQKEIAAELRRGSAELKLSVRAPVRYELWKLRSWRVWVKVNCEVSVDKLEKSSKVVSQRCSTKLDLW